MFGLDLENDEWLALIGMTCLLLRVFYGIGRVVWLYANDSPPPQILGFMKVNLFLPFLTFAAVSMMSIALISMVSGGLAKEFRIVAYCMAGGIGFSLGVMLEARISIRLYKFSLWLHSYRIPRYREQLQSGNSTERLAAAERLAKLGPYSRLAWDELVVALRDESADVRAVSGRAMVNANPKPPLSENRDASSKFQTALTDPDYRVRTAAAAILVQFQAVSPSEVLPVLIEGLKQGDKQTAIVAHTGLSLLGPDAAPACEVVRDVILQRQGIVTDGSAVLTQQEIIKHDVETGSFITILQSIGAPSVPALIEIIERGSLSLKYMAIHALGHIGEPARAALPLLRKIARERSILGTITRRTIRKLGGDAV